MVKPPSSSREQSSTRSILLKAPALRQRLQDCFELIKDPRVERTRTHQLTDILTIAILSTIAGGKGWEDMEIYGESKEAWLSTFLALPDVFLVLIRFDDCLNASVLNSLSNALNNGSTF